MSFIRPAPPTPTARSSQATWLVVFFILAGATIAVFFDMQAPSGALRWPERDGSSAVSSTQERLNGLEAAERKTSQDLDLRSPAKYIPSPQLEEPRQEDGPHWRAVEPAEGGNTLRPPRHREQPLGGDRCFTVSHSVVGVGAVLLAMSAWKKKSATQQVVVIVVVITMLLANSPCLVPAFTSLQLTPPSIGLQPKSGIAPGTIRGDVRASSDEISVEDEDFDKVESLPGDDSAEQFPAELVKYASKLYAKTLLMDESEDHGITPGKRLVRHPFMSPEPLQSCLRGKRVLFLGHSHLQAIAEQLAAGLGVRFVSIDAWFGHSKGFLVRKMFDGAPFSLYHESLVSLNYRAALRKATPEVVDAHRFDVIYVTRSMWDLVYYDTHPKEFADSFSEALVELLDVFLKKNGGKLVVWPLHSVKSDRDRRGCFPQDRALLIREATFLAIRQASEKSGVPIVGPGAASSSSQSIIIWDPYDFTTKLEPKRMPDGQHVDTRTAFLFAEVIIRGVLQCNITSMSALTSRVVNSSLLDGIPQSMQQKIDWLAATPKSQIPWGKRKCRCGRTDLGIESVHPTCVNYSPKSRHLMVQRYLKHPLVGASELQMKELIYIICTEKRSSIVRDCFHNIGVTEEMSEDLTLPVIQPLRPSASHRCTCLNATTSVQGLNIPGCAAIASLEITAATCPFFDPNATFVA